MNPQDVNETYIIIENKVIESIQNYLQASLYLELMNEVITNERAIIKKYESEVSEKLKQIAKYHNFFYENSQYARFSPLFDIYNTANCNLSGLEDGINYCRQYVLWAYITKTELKNIYKKNFFAVPNLIKEGQIRENRALGSGFYSLTLPKIFDLSDRLTYAKIALRVSNPFKRVYEVVETDIFKHFSKQEIDQTFDLEKESFFQLVKSGIIS